jgi:hypothetical protein
MKSKYTEEQEIEMQALYEACETFEERSECVDMLADKYRKTDRMIIAKLSKMQVYITKPKTSKVTGTKPETKEQMVKRLETKLKWPPGDFNGLEKAPKLVIQKLLEEYKRED